MKLPQKSSDKEFLDTFPMLRFKIVLVNLTFDQKQKYYDKHKNETNKR